MGIAASQARYLYLTARQTTVEFEGQQINQARTNLANEEAGLFNQMLELKAPTMPTQYVLKQNLAKWDEAGGPNPADYAGGESDPQYITDRDLYDAYVNTFDRNFEKTYDYAVSQYNSKNQEYQKEMDRINEECEDIHQRDKVLELQLRQLDTEQETITTELESVKKVLDKNIEQVFKTFQS